MRVTDNMRIASAANAQSAIASRLDKATRIAAQGSAVVEPSDDPVAFGAKVRDDNELALIESRSQMATTASGELGVAESALSTGVDLLSQARAAAVQGANGALDAPSRKLIAAQIDGIRQNMLAVANTRFGTKYLFAGSKTDTAPFADDGTFVGNDVISKIPLGDGVAPDGNVSGATTFTAAGGRDVLADLQTLSDALNNNDVAGISTSIGNLDSAHTQLVQGETAAGLSAERFTSATTVMASTKIAVTAAKSSQVDGDTLSQLTELSQAQAAYQRGIDITKQLLNLPSLASAR